MQDGSKVQVTLELTFLDTIMMMKSMKLLRGYNEARMLSGLCDKQRFVTVMDGGAESIAREGGKCFACADCSGRDSLVVKPNWR